MKSVKLHEDEASKMTKSELELLIKETIEANKKFVFTLNYPVGEKFISITKEEAIRISQLSPSYDGYQKFYEYKTVEKGIHAVVRFGQ